jgi:hypothetical protein
VYRSAPARAIEQRKLTAASSRLNAVHRRDAESAEITQRKLIYALRILCVSAVEEISH